MEKGIMVIIIVILGILIGGCGIAIKGCSMIVDEVSEKGLKTIGNELMNGTNTV